MNKSKIISVSGLIGSGKDTVSSYLIDNYGYVRYSFADTLKDAISYIFGWSRELLDGKTDESREWREHVDYWWSKKLNIPNLTPRYVLQYIGTDVMRNHFHQDIWIYSTERRISQINDPVVISDLRFYNEFDMVKRLNGTAILVKRGDDPEWIHHAAILNQNPNVSPIARDAIKELNRLNIHSSEYSWVGLPFDITIENNSTLENLYNSVDKYL